MAELLRPEIWRVAPTHYVIRRQGLGTRERWARFGQSRDWGAKFALGGAARSFVDDNQGPHSMDFKAMHDSQTSTSNPRVGSL